MAQQFIGKLSIEDSTSTLDPPDALLLMGSPGKDPQQAATDATAYIEAMGIQSGARVRVTGTLDAIGGQATIWMTAISAISGRGQGRPLQALPPQTFAKAANKKVATTKKAAAKKTAVKKKTAKGGVAKSTSVKKKAARKNPRGKRE